MRFLTIFLVLVGLLVIMACEEEGGVGVPTTTPEATIVETPIPQAPTVTPSLPVISAAECEYLDAMLRQSEQLGGVLIEFGLLTEQPEPLSETWRRDLAVQIAMIKMISEDIRALETPSELANLHNKRLASLGLWEEAMDSLMEGIDELDLAKTEKGFGLMAEAIEEAKGITALINEFRASRSGVCP